MILTRSIALCLLLSVAAAGEPVNPRAVERYKQMLEKNPAEGTALERLWKAYSDAGRSADLLKEYEAAKTFPERMVQGHLLRRAERADEAIAAYRAAAELNPTSPLAWQGIARIEAQAGRNANAADAWTAAAERMAAGDAGLTEALLEAGNAWLAAGEGRKATEAWEKTVAATPRDTALRERLVETYLRNGLLDAAIPHLEYVVANGSPKARAEGLKQLARVHQLAGRSDAAIQALERAIGLTAPGNWLREELQDQLIRYHQRLHRTNELENRWLAYATRNPRDVAGYLQLLALYERLGELEKERAWLEKLVELVPKDTGYRWRLARLLLRLDDIKAATALYDQLLASQPANAELIFERAELEVRSQRPEEGAKRIAQFTATRPDDEAIQGRAMEFFEQHHLTAWTERQLRADLRSGKPEKVRLLVDFLFTQDRNAEAEQELRRLIRTTGTPEEQAASLLETARTLKNHGRAAPALQLVQQALALLPRDAVAARDAYLLAAELHLAAKDTSSARDSLETAVSLSRTPAEEAAADQKLFDVLRLNASGEETRPSSVMSIPTLAVPGGTGHLSGELRAFVDALALEAGAKNTEKAWLRLARWRAWTRDKGGALEAARRAVDEAPTSIAAHEALINLAAADPASPTAVAYLQRLATLDPEHRAQHMQRIAQFKLQSGNLRDARTTLEELADAQPGNIDALQDLAHVLERSQDWAAAAEVWGRIYRAGQTSRNRDALAPLLRAMEELGQIQPAAEKLLAEVNTATDSTVRTKLFDQLLALCTKHELLPWLAAEWQKRRLRAEDTHYNEVAYSQILKAQGDSAGAFQALWDASFSAPDLSEALPDLIQEAEERYNFTAAVELQGRLLRTQAKPEPAAFLKLAQLQERTLALDELSKTWSQAVARFPREPSILLPAAEFFVDLGQADHASALYQQAIEVEPANGKALLARAGIELAQGRRANATAALEQLLARLKPSSAKVTIRLPQLSATEGGRLQGAYLSAVRHRRGSPRVESMRALQQFWVDGAGPQDAAGEMRFRAIEQLAELVRPSTDAKVKQRWLARWTAAAENAPGEALWALYHSGHADAALSIVERQAAKDPADKDHQQALLWFALQTGQWERLGKWVRDPARTPNDGDFLIVALGQYLQSEEFAPLDDAALGHLFPPKASSRIWQAAALYAAQAQFAEAARIGEKAFTAAAGAREESFGQELANWYLSAGETESALKVLTKIANKPGENFDSPVYAAIRQCYLLLPPAERSHYVEQMSAHLAGAKNPVHRCLGLALLHGLAGDLEKSKSYLNELVRMRPMAPFAVEDQSSSSTRAWTFLLGVGLQLQAWKMEPLTEHIWSRLLADPALVSLEGEGPAEIARDMRLRLFALRAALASPSEFEGTLNAYQHDALSNGLIPLGEALDNIGAARQSLAVFRRAWEQEPGNPQALRNLLNACRTAQDVKATEAVLRSCVEERLFRTNEALHRDLLAQLADVLDQQGGSAEALRLLTTSAQEAPQDPRLLQRLALFQERLGKLKEAEASWRQVVTIDGVNPAYRLSLATLLQRTGRLEEAIKLLDESRDSQGEVRLAELYLQAGRTDDALAICYRATPAQLSALMIRLLPRIFEQCGQSAGRSVLQFALERITDASAALQLRMKLAESFDPAKERPLLARELRRIRRLASQTGAQEDAYLEWLPSKARELHLETYVRDELRGLWENGAGKIAAGIALCTFESPRPAEAETILSQLLERHDLTMPSVDRLIGLFEAAGQWESLARLQARGVEMNALDDSRLIAWVRTLHKLRGAPSARAAFDRWSARFWLSEDSAALAGAMYAELGAPEEAEALLLHAIRHDPFGRNSSPRIELARLKRLEGDLAAAKALLIQAYRGGGQLEFAELIEWIDAAGKLPTYEAELRAFGLGDHQMMRAQQALFRRHVVQRNAPAAYALLQAHPEIYNAELGAPLRDLARATATFSQAVAFLEDARTAEARPASQNTDLARILFDWSEAEHAVDLSRLERATELNPAFHDAVIRLARAYVAQSKREKAITLLERFLAYSQDEKDRESARALLRETKLTSAGI